MKTFFRKLFIFVLMLFSLQMLIYPYFKWGTPPELQSLEDCLEQHVDIIFMGDSTLFWSAKNTARQTTIPAMLREQLPDCTIGTVMHEAFQMDVYRDFCRYIARHSATPPRIIIPINLRSFAPEWDLHPFYQFEKIRMLLALDTVPLARPFYRPLAGFKLFSRRLDINNYMITPVYNETGQVGVMGDYQQAPSKEEQTPELLANKTFYQYMLPLDGNNRKVVSLKEIDRIASENDMQIYFYFTPIDYQAIERYLGEKFPPRFKANTDFIKGLLNAKSITVIDLSLSLTSESFTFQDRFWLNEHLTDSGKLFIAQQLAKTLRNSP